MYIQHNEDINAMHGGEKDGGTLAKLHLRDPKILP